MLLMYVYVYFMILFLQARTGSKPNKCKLMKNNKLFHRQDKIISYSS